MTKKKVIFISLLTIIIGLSAFIYNYLNYLSYSDRANIIALQESLVPVMENIEKNLEDPEKHFPYFYEEISSITVNNHTFTYKVAPNGSIIAKNEKVLVVFFPTKKENKYIWECSGYPGRYVPLKCR